MRRAKEDFEETKAARFAATVEPKRKLDDVAPVESHQARARLPKRICLVTEIVVLLAALRPRNVRSLHKPAAKRECARWLRAAVTG